MLVDSISQWLWLKTRVHGRVRNWKHEFKDERDFNFIFLFFKMAQIMGWISETSKGRLHVFFSSRCNCLETRLGNVTEPIVVVDASKTSILVTRKKSSANDLQTGPLSISSEQQTERFCCINFSIQWLCSHLLHLVFSLPSMIVLSLTLLNVSFSWRFFLIALFPSFIMVSYKYMYHA